MRVVSAAAMAALQSKALPLATLVEMDLSQPLYLNTGGLDLTIAGATYYGTKGLGSIDVVKETAAEVAKLNFTLSGVPSDLVALSLTEVVQGKAVRIKLAIFDPASYQIVDVQMRWAGRLDTMQFQGDSGGSSLITVSAEHAGIDLTRPGTSLYTHEEQQRLHPGDLAFQFLNDQVEQRIVWPAASWGRQG